MADKDYRGQAGLKLHLGCGQDYWTGYVNIDVDPSAKADLYLNVTELDAQFEAGSVVEIAMYHVINYLSLWEARAFFRTARKLLAPGGRLIIETVDLQAACKKLTASQGQLADYLEGVRSLHAFGRDHMEAQADFVPNKFSWTRWHLEYELTAAGFPSIRATAAESHAPWRDMRLEASTAAQAFLPTAGKRVLFLLFYPMGSITMHIRGRIFEDLLDEAGWTVTYLDVQKTTEDEVIEVARLHDIVYSLKVPFVGLYVRLRSETRARLVFDLTDALWMPHHRDSGWKDLELILALCDGIFCDNEFVADYGRRFSPNVRVIRACTQVERFSALRAVRPPRDDGRVVIGWVGTHGTLGAIEVVKPALQAICQRHPEVEVRLLCLNFANADTIDLSGIRCSVRADYDETGMIEEILAFDIGLFPPPCGAEDYAIRGPLKTLLYMSGTLPSVSLRAGELVSVIDDGVNGMLAGDIEEWEAKIEALVASPELRRRMGDAAFATVMARNSLAVVAERLADCLAEIVRLPQPVAAADLFLPTAMPQPADAGIPAMAPARILIACDFFWPSIGGVETIVRNLGETLIAQGHTVDVAARALPNRTSDHYRGMRIHSLDAETPGGDGLPLASSQLRKLIESGQFDGVIFRADPLNWVIWSLEGARIPAGTRTLVQPLINEDGLAQWGGNATFRQRLAAVLRQASAVVLLTRSGPDRRFLEEESLPSVYLPNATEPALPDEDFRAAHDISPERPLIVHVANLWAVKNHLALLDALRKAPGDWTLVLIGHPSADRAYVDKVRKAVRLDSRVRLIEGLPAGGVAAAMQAADLVVLPSKGEVSPVSILEAMSHGRPWIATPECGAANDASGGVIAPLTSFPAVIRRLLSNPDMRFRLGELGKRHWQHCNRWPVVAAAWANLVGQGRLPRELAPPAEVAAESAAIAADCLGYPCTFSVILTTVNRPDMLLNAVRSVLAQDVTDFELIVVNDGGPSVDAILTDLDPDKRILSLRLPCSGGPGRARNQGLAVARGRYVVFLDDDDLFYPNHLSTLLAGLRETPDQIIYTDAVVVMEEVSGGKRCEISRTNPWEHGLFLKQRLWVNNFIPILSFAASRVAMLATGGFDETLRALEDWDFLLKLATRTDFRHLRKVTSEVRLRPSTRDRRTMSAKENGAEAATFSRIHARHGDLGDPIVRLGRKQLINGLTPPLLLPDSDAWNSAYQDWLATDMRQPTPPQPATNSVSLLVLCLAPPHSKRWLQATLDAIEAANIDSLHLVFIGEGQPLDPRLDNNERCGWLSMETLSDDALNARAMNAVIAQFSSDWVTLWPPGTVMHQTDLHRLAANLAEHPNWQAAYTDHDSVIHPQGIRYQPCFKPDFNLDLLRNQDYIGPSVWFRSQALAVIGGFAPFPGSWHYEALWRIWGSYGAASIGHIAAPLVHLPAGDEPHPLREAARRVALENHLKGIPLPATVREGHVAGCTEVEFLLPSPLPLVSIVIAADGIALPVLKRCLESLVATTPPGCLEILLAGSQVHSSLIAEWSCRLTLRQISPDIACGPAAALLSGAVASKAPLILFLDGRSEARQSGWLEKLVMHVQRPDVGAVGGVLVDPVTGLIRDGARFLGLGSVADTAYAACLPDNPLSRGRQFAVQNVSALGAGCLMIRRELLTTVGNWEHTLGDANLAAADFCLQLARHKLLTVWHPGSILCLHGEVESTAPAAAFRFASQWLPILGMDPHYNPNLSLAHADCRIETTARNVDEGKALPLVAALVPAGRSGLYRLTRPLEQLVKDGKIRSSLVSKADNGGGLGLGQLARMQPQTVMCSSATEPEAILATFRHSRELLPACRRILVMDAPLPDAQVWSDILALSDRLIASTEVDASAVPPVTDIRVIPESIALAQWQDMSPAPRNRSRPRVVWIDDEAGGSGLRSIREVVRVSASDIDWIVVGSDYPELSYYAQTSPCTVTQYPSYPQLLADLAPDLVVIPAPDRPAALPATTRTMLECGALGIPVLMADDAAITFAPPPPVFRAAHTANDWALTLKSTLLTHRRSAFEMGKALQAWTTQHGDIESRIGDWVAAILDN